MPKAKRNYNSVEFALDKRLANSWMCHGSYMWSRDAGNYSGLSSSDENGRDNPNNSARLRLPVDDVRPDGKLIDGVLATDRTHQVKAQALYQFKWGTTVGLNEFLASGTPITRQVPIIAASNYPIRYLGREQRGPDADVLAVRPVSCSTRSRSAAAGDPAQCQRAEPVRPAHRHQPGLDRRRTGVDPATGPATTAKPRSTPASWTSIS